MGTAGYTLLCALALAFARRGFEGAARRVPKAFRQKPRALPECQIVVSFPTERFFRKHPEL